MQEVTEALIAGYISICKVAEIMRCFLKHYSCTRSILTQHLFEGNLE